MRCQDILLVREVTPARPHRPHVWMQMQEAVLCRSFLHSQVGGDPTQNNFCPDTTNKELLEAATDNLVLNFGKNNLSKIPVPGTNGDNLMMANKNYQHRKVRDVLVVLVDQMLTMREEHCPKVLHDF